jgi:very-short-patch-repair endonuclease
MITDFQQARLLSLIDYVEATERDKLKTVLDVNQHKGFNYVEADLSDLPGVVLNQAHADDVIWLEVARLAKRPPPVLGDLELKCWVILPDNTETKPKIRSEITGPTLVEAGLIDATDVPESVRLDDYEHALRLSNSFDAYVAGPWAQWSLDERQRRRAIALYNALFALRQLLDGASETPIELVCGIGFSTLYRANQRMRHPLLTVPMEIALNDVSHAIEVRPRLEALPGIETDVLDKMELVSVDEWQNFTAKFVADLEDEPLSPFARETFEPLLKRAVAVLDSDAIYTPDQRNPQNRNMPSVETTLQISDVFGFFQRERRATQLMEDLRRFRLAIENDDEEIEFPAAVNAVVTDPADGPSDEDYPAFRGISTIPGITSSDGSGQDLFFPKPFNREQVEVVQRLALRPGVVVQGPPGTGKTHTIANIISHYLALGKRVLVTSQKAPALKVLRGQLPVAIRPLAVSLLDSDRDGLKQFQESVDIIAERLQRTKRHELAQEISDLDLQIDNLHRALAKIDREVDGIGRSATAPVDLEGEQIEPLKAAGEVVDERERSEWLDDIIDVTPEFAPSYSDREVIALRQARKLLGQDLAYLDVQIPRPDDFPDDDALVEIHRDLSRAETLRRQIAAGELVELIDRSDETIGRAEALLADLKDIQFDRAAISDANYAWTEAATARLRRWASDEAIDALETMLPAINSLSDEARHFLTRPIALPDDALEDAKLIEAITRCANGETGVGLVAGIFASKLKARLASIRIVGQAPRSAAEWMEIKRFVDGLLEAQRIKLSWNHAVSHTCLDTTNADGLAVGRSLQSQLDHLASIRELIASEAGLELEASSLLPRWAMPISGSSPSTSALIETVESHLLRHRLDRAEAIRLSLGEKLRRCGGVLSDRFRECFAHDLGNPEMGDSAFRQKWMLLKQQLDALCDKESALAIVKATTGSIEANGAPLWAERLRSEPVEGIEDALTPGDWGERWRLRRLGTWLSRIDRHGRLRALSVERAEKENLLKQAYERSIELRTWLELRTKATDSVQSALAAYADAVRRIGRGTGKRAARYRRDARAASDRAKGALPCWIMPHYRVSESLPSDLGLFDLVIVDEASQSTVAALPALLRAKQILIVGDDRQVSPELVGRDQSRADELARRHLAEQVVDYRSSLREEQSLYDLGKVVFAGGAIMLTEHFRCVAPIIEFSKAQFYSHRLLPLRLPAASERLDPPLIDILVEDGYRKGKTNPPEADCIVSEIQKIADDPMMGKRTIGVTTLLGQEQAALIYSKIEQIIGTEVMERHQIRVGDPTAFQGDERDIMFVSLVAEKQDHTLSPIEKRYQQRFNVALSRARDRMVLVRSVELSDLRQGDTLRRAVLEHFRVPFPSEGLSATNRRERCESPFETEMFDMLAERGFRIDTQVPVGNFRIDLVVEGENDRRLAIECDGDRYHGPDKWSDDMVRQRILERAGWEIWRCFASRFVRDREGVLNELLALLRERGIEPVATSEGWVSRHTEQRRWRTPSVDNHQGIGLFDEEYAPGLQDDVEEDLPSRASAPIVSQPSPEASVAKAFHFSSKPGTVRDTLSTSSVSPSKTHSADSLDLFGAAESTPNTVSNDAASSFSRVTENDVQIAILELMKNRGQWTNAELKRQLRTILPLSPADMAQANFRPNEEKWEELVNNALSQSRGNSLLSKGLVKSHARGRHLITDAGIARLTQSSANVQAAASKAMFTMSADKARIALIELREREIKPKYPDSDPSKGLLRKSMIDELLRAKPTTEAEFRIRIRQDLREATDGEQFQNYIAKVFEILERLS